KNISLAWHNLRYDFDDNVDDRQQQQQDYNHNNYRKKFNKKFDLKNFLLFHQRRGSISTPTTTIIQTSTTNSNQINEKISNDQSSPILRRLTGYFEFHTVNGLLGPSNHARKTLLKCLTGSIRYSSGISSDSRIYRYETNDIKSRNHFAWIIRNVDNLITFNHMTVNELLRYSYIFHNGILSLFRSYQQHINTIFEQLSIEKDKVIDKKLNECSYKEKRLISIAQEMMSIDSMPTFMFMDEPFENLDIISAEKILLSIKNISKKYSITMIISAKIFDSYLITLFDKLYILAHGGVCIYSGSPKLLVSTLEKNLGIINSSHNNDNVDDNNNDDECIAIEEMLKISCFEFTNPKVRKLADKTLLEEHHFLLPYLQKLEFQPKISDIPCKCFSIIDLFIQSYRQFRLLYLNRWFPLKLLISILYYLFLAFFLIDNEMIIANRCYDSISERLIVPSNQTCEQIINEQIMIDGYVTYQMYSMWFLASWSILTTSLHCLKMLNLFCNDYQNRRFSFNVFIISSFFINLIESIIWSTIFTCLMYFLIDHTMIENHHYYNHQTTIESSSNNKWLLSSLSNVNIQRFNHVLFAYWLLYLYHQAYGILLSVLIYPLNKKNFNSSNKNNNNYSIVIMITIGQLIVIIFQLLNNNILVIIDRIHSLTIRSIASTIISLQPIYDTVLYSFYSLERSCDYHHHHHSHYQQNDYHRSNNNRYSSSVFKQYSIPLEFNEIINNLISIVIIIIVIRIISFLLLWYYFCPKLIIRCSTNNNNKNNKKHPSSTTTTTSSNHHYQSQIIPIDYGPTNRKKAKVRIIQPIFKDDEEVEFCRDKIQLAWRSLSLFACCKKTTDHKCDSESNLILKNLNGQFRLGSLNAVIGGSNDNIGCHNGNIRTLLLRIFNGQLKTRLTSDTQFYESQFASNNVCFISRYPKEHLISGLTVKQSLIYASIIKNIEDDDYSASRLDHEEMALNILDELDLGHQSGSYVDDCNQSERKRLVLALELTSLQMPNLICIEEPIFDLDAINAEQFIRCLRQLTDRHSITFVVSFQHTQHQILAQFDQIYCLSSNGHCIYSGSSKPQSIRQHLNQSIHQITETSLLSSSKRAIEELLRYSCLDSDDCTISSAIEQLVKQNDQQTLKANELLPQETISLEHKGIKSNVASFSIMSILRLSRRYRGRWFYSLWFHWIIYASIYFIIALLLNGLFGSEITKPDGCIRKDIFNATAVCPQYRTGTKMIWDIDGEHLWDNYRYVYISTHLFLMLILFQSAMIFYQEIKIFLHEHQNGWFSSSVFYICHFIWIDFLPIIPITMIYLYLIDIDHFDYPYYEPDEIIDNDRQLPHTYYWWAVILISIAIESIHSLSHLVVIISTNRIRSESIFLILLSLFALLSITSNFQIQTKFSLSFLNVFRYLNEAILILHYGYFNSCSSPLSRSAYIRQQQQPISLVLYRIGSDDLNPDLYFYHYLRILICQTILFRLGSLFALLLRANGDRIFHHHRLWMTGKSSSTTIQSQSSSYLDHHEWSATTTTTTTIEHSNHHEQQEPSPSTSTGSTFSDLATKHSSSSSPSSLDSQNNDDDDDDQLEFRL
ncbi:uncharacterized protein LOC113797443, partial [Dermatophagoides pteronyssinus]|uniref:uncharacterized protein LOC113797443 n=1 Tax=Dermatophagoides pteronyssinus TaxID=6956 RepID=UPI003F667AB8